MCYYLRKDFQRQTVIYYDRLQHFYMKNAFFRMTLHFSKLVLFLSIYHFTDISLLA